MKKYIIIIIILSLFCLSLIIMSFSLKSQLDSKSCNVDCKCEKVEKNNAYVCELKPENTVNEYVIREEIEYDSDGTVTLNKSGAVQTFKNKEEFDGTISDAKRYGHHYEIFGEKTVYVYDLLDVYIENSIGEKQYTWYKDYLTDKKIGGYSCKELEKSSKN